MLPPTVLARIPPSSLANFQVSDFAERLLHTGAPVAADDADLAAALDAYARQAQPDELGALEEFLATHPILRGGWRYRYDAENRLVAIQPQDVTSELEYRFGYDGLGRRVSESGNDSLRSLTWCSELICRLRSRGGSATYPYPQGKWRAGRRLYQGTGSPEQRAGSTGLGQRHRRDQL